ncbi:cytadherence high molecular weight protein 1-like [Spodoptera frugiperda]|uniref:Cytadherence high molecular weight protein 1-like n=1 Tax=Spodoptera frugiperda TaxID=7108 RepID=A0A9R0CZY0_SPOFR|nr:cytadherence high molecular weight protein 1-like [Spodoptera frugiperda]
MKVLYFALLVAAVAATPLPEDGSDAVEMIVNGVPDGTPLEISDIVDIKLKEHVDGEVVAASNLLHPYSAVGIAEAQAAVADDEANKEVEFVDNVEVLDVQHVPEAVILPAPVAPEVVVPEPVVMPSPVAPEVAIPEPVVMPSPVAPEVVVPEPVVMPSPVAPEVVVPEPVVMPSPVAPEVIIPEPVVMPSPVAPEVVIPEPVVMPSPVAPEVAIPEPVVMPSPVAPVVEEAPVAALYNGEVYNDGLVQVQYNGPAEPGMFSTIQSWFNVVLNYFSSDAPAPSH